MVCLILFDWHHTMWYSGFSANATMNHFWFSTWFLDYCCTYPISCMQKICQQKSNIQTSICHWDEASEIIWRPLKYPLLHLQWCADAWTFPCGLETGVLRIPRADEEVPHWYLHDGWGWWCWCWCEFVLNIGWCWLLWLWMFPLWCCIQN